MMVAWMDFATVTPTSGAILSSYITPPPWSPAFPSIASIVPTFVSPVPNCSDPAGPCWNYAPPTRILENPETKRTHNHGKREYRQFSKHHKRKRKHKHVKKEPHPKYKSRAAFMPQASNDFENGGLSSDLRSGGNGGQYYPFFAVLLPSMEPGREKIALEGIAMKSLTRPVLKEQFRESRDQHLWPKNELQKLLGNLDPYYQSWNASGAPAKQFLLVEGSGNSFLSDEIRESEAKLSDSLTRTDEYETNLSLSSSLAPKKRFGLGNKLIEKSTEYEKNKKTTNYQLNNFTTQNEQNLASTLHDQYFSPSLTSERRHRNVPVSSKEDKPYHRMLSESVKLPDVRWSSSGSGQHPYTSWTSSGSSQHPDTHWTSSGSGQYPDSSRIISGHDTHRRFFQTYELEEPRIFSVELPNEAHSTEGTVLPHMDEHRADTKVPSVIAQNYPESNINKNSTDLNPHFFTNFYSKYRQSTNDKDQPTIEGREQNQEDGRRKSNDRDWPYDNKGSRHSYNSIPTSYDKEEHEEELMRKITKEVQISLPQKTHSIDIFSPSRKAGKNRPQGGKLPGEPGPEDDSDEEEGRKQWDRLGQLIIVVTLAALGTVGNIFAISAIISERSLRKAGNILLANTMIACLLVTAGVLPAGVVDLLAGWTHPSPVCKPVWVLTILAAYTVLLTLPCLAWENHARQHSTRPLPGCVLVAIIIASWCAAFSLTAAQWAGGYGPTHCEVGLISHDSLTACVGVPLVVTPILIMIILHSHTLLHTPKVPVSRPSIDPDRSSPSETNTSKKSEPQKDLALVATNLAVGLITGGLWAGGVAIDWWGSPEGRLNWLPSIAASSCGFLYAAHRPFRDAYYQLFNYCCCKTTVSMARRGRGDTPMELYAGYNTSTSRTTTEHVRVHIIPPYNMYSQSSPRPTQHCSSSKPTRSKERRHKPSGKKEIYEL